MNKYNLDNSIIIIYLMQKNQRKAYILIWSIFLSITIWITFISISSQISKDLKNNYNLKEKINVHNSKNNKINDALNTNNFNNIELNKNEIIIFEKDNYLNIWLNNNQEVKIKITDNKNLTIKVNIWAPISYINESDPNINWTIISTDTFLPGIWNIIIKNLWWYSNVDITWEVKFETKYKKYKVIEKIWNKNINKENWEIKLF